MKEDPRPRAKGRKLKLPGQPDLRAADGYFGLIHALARSPIGLTLVAVIALTLLSGLGMMTLSRYRLFVRWSTGVVELAPPSEPQSEQRNRQDRSNPVPRTASAKVPEPK
jgi:hypothetical protein